MKKIMTIFILGMFLLAGLPTFFASEAKASESPAIIPYRVSINYEEELETVKVDKMAFQGDDVGLLWSHTGNGSFVFSSLINNDDVPDILASSYAINGINGETLFQFTYGEVIALGDVNNDGIDEVITYRDNVTDPIQYSKIYCYSIHGNLIWQKEINSSWVLSASIGNVTGGGNNELIVGVGDFAYRGNNYIYCLNGNTGNTIWRKHTGDYVQFVEIDDVNADGENEIIAGTRNNDPHVYCLDGEGITVWELAAQFASQDFRYCCITNLNSDPYKEILIEWNYDGINCLSGNNGLSIWNWSLAPPLGSFQTIQSADLIAEYTGNEVIVGGVPGLYCLRGTDNLSGDREIWQSGEMYGYNDFVMAAVIVDLNKDNLLDVVSMTFCGYVRAVNGQNGQELWKYEQCGNDVANKGLLCADLTLDGFSEVIAKDENYVCALVSSNYPPTAPIISGEVNGIIWTRYDYTFSASDSDGFKVYYYIDWGDGRNSGWVGPFISGVDVTISHTWLTKGTYNIKAKAKDMFGTESDWTTLPVTMPLDLQNSQSSPQSNPSSQNQRVSSTRSISTTISGNQALEIITKTTSK